MTRPDGDMADPAEDDYPPRTRHDRTSDACHMGACRLCEEQQDRDEQEDETCDATAEPSSSTTPDSSLTPTVWTALAGLDRAQAWPGNKQWVSLTQQATYETTTPETT